MKLRTANCKTCELRTLRTANPCETANCEPLRRPLRKPAEPRSCEITRSCETDRCETCIGSATSGELQQCSRETQCPSPFVPFFPPSQQKLRTLPPCSRAALHPLQRPTNPLSIHSPLVLGFTTAHASHRAPDSNLPSPSRPFPAPLPAGLDLQRLSA